MEALILIILSWILYITVSSIKGILDGYIWHYWLESWFKKILKFPNALKDMQKEGALIHKIGVLPLLGLLLFILIIATFNIRPLSILFLGISLSTVNPLFHLGAMFYTRNKLNKLVYPKSYKSESLISDGNTDKFKKITHKLFNTYKKRVIFAIISIIFLTLTIIFK
jgi:hypothetical protein